MAGILNGKIIAITRDKQAAASFSGLVGLQGGSVIAIPAIETVPASEKQIQKFANLLMSGHFDYCAFLSARPVTIVFGKAHGKKTSRRRMLSALAYTSVIAIGPRTKRALETLGIRVDIMPENHSSPGLLDCLSNNRPGGKKILLARSAVADKFLSKSLREMGMVVKEISLYSTRTRSASKVRHTWKQFVTLLERRSIYSIVFTSASNVRAFFEILPQFLTGYSLEGIRIISIGPYTSKELRKRGVKYVEAKEHTIQGVFEVLLRR